MTGKVLRGGGEKSFFERMLFMVFATLDCGFKSAIQFKRCFGFSSILSVIMYCMLKASILFKNGSILCGAEREKDC